MLSSLSHRSTILIVALSAGLCPRAFGQIEIYNTHYFSSNGQTLYATTTTTGSFSMVVGCSGYIHNYYASASMTGPNGAKSTGGGLQGSGSVSACGTGTATSTAQIATGGGGAYYIDSSESADCSYYGEFLDTGQGPDETIDGPIIGGISDYAVNRDYEYVDTSGYISIYGDWLAAGGTDMDPQIDVDDPTHIQLGTPTYVQDGQINVPFTITAGVASGGGSPHNITVTTDYGTSNPGQLYVYDQTPSIQSVSQTPWTEGTTYSGVTITGSNFGTVCSVAISGAGNTTFSVTSCTNTSVQGNVTVDPNATGSSSSVNATLSLTSGGYGQGFQSAPGGSSQAPNYSVEVLAAAPTITSVTLNPNVVGSTSATMTINGKNLSGGTPYLPSGFTITENNNSGGSQMVLTVNIALTASYGTNCCNVSIQAPTSKSSKAFSFTVDGPGSMMVTADTTGLCPGCTTTVKRFVTYEIKNISGTVSTGTYPICETPTDGPWSCTQTQPTLNYNKCNVDPGTYTGTFTDGWSLSQDGLTPVGCGFTITDEWLFNPGGASVQWAIGHLSGYIHTNSVEINGNTTAMAPGTVINP
jgi:hypothetical protein